MTAEVYLTSMVLAIGGLWYLWDQGIKKLFLDYFRDRIFELRFELFELAASGRLEFNSEAYREIETLLCGLLRFGHRVTFLAYIKSVREQEQAKAAGEFVDHYSQIELGVSRAPEDVRAQLRTILKRTGDLVTFFSAVCSLLFIAIALVYGTLRLLNLVKGGFKRKVGRVMEAEAYQAESRRLPPAGAAVA